ncbi:hypothetical protein HWI79_3047 [Cryptosporidium felis]|nr:hypothetical protein HWI79_3047 [Cryptosporidium felis]
MGDVKCAFLNKLGLVLLSLLIYSFFIPTLCLEHSELLEVCSLVDSSLNKSLINCYTKLNDSISFPTENFGIIYQIQEKEKKYIVKVLLYEIPNEKKTENSTSKDENEFRKCFSELCLIEINNLINSKLNIEVSTILKTTSELPSNSDLKEIDIKDKNGNLKAIRRIFKFDLNSVNNLNEMNMIAIKDKSDSENMISKTTTATVSASPAVTGIENHEVTNAMNKPYNEETHFLGKPIDSGGLCAELSSEELIDLIKFQNTFLLPDVIYLEVSTLLRRIAKRIDLQRSAEESLSIVMPGIGGLIVSEVHCEEVLRVTLVTGELTTLGIGPNEFPIICQKLQQCLIEQSFHNSVVIGLSKCRKYVDFALKRNRNFMWETLNKMVGILGNTNGLKSYQLWLELEIMISRAIPEEVLHSDLPKEMILMTDLIKNSKLKTVDCTISLMRIGASYEIRLSQITEVARLCNRIFSDSTGFLSVDEMRLISDTTILSRIADWMIGTFILEKHIPPGVTKPAACMYLSAITSPMDYSTITNFLWPRIVFALSSSSPSALSFTSKSVDPENCRKSLQKVLKILGDKLQINIDETCGKMASCILNGRIGRISIDDTISNALNQSKQTINYDFGTNSASLRLARFIFESKAPIKSRKNGFSKLSAPLRGSVLFGHLQSIMPGGFSINDIVKFVHSFTKESPPSGPAKKCFKVLIKYIPVFISSDKELKTICTNAFGPWIMPDILVSDVMFSHSTLSKEIVV